MIMELQNFYYLSFFFGNCHVIIPYEEISFSGDWNDFFPYMQVSPFLLNMYKQSITLCLQIHMFRQRLNNQIAAAMLQVMPTLYASYAKISHFSANTYGKNYCE